MEMEVVGDRNVEIEYLPGNVRNHCEDISHLEWERNREKIFILPKWRQGDQKLQKLQIPLLFVRRLT